MNMFGGKASEIIPGQLYLGNMASARRILDMETLNIGAIVNCTCEVPNYYENHEDIVVKYLKIEIDDHVNQNIAKHFDSTFEFIENSIEKDGKAVLVHCQAGISRSSSIVIAYVMRKLNLSLKDAFVKVRNCRSIIMPNMGFYKQLLEYEMKLRGSNSLERQQYYELSFIGNSLFNIYSSNINLNN